MADERLLEAVPSENEVQTEPTGAGPKPKRAKTGGRQKGSTTAGKRWAARAIAEKLKFHGLAELIEVYKSGLLPIVAGEKIAQRATPAQRLRCLEQAALYLWPRLSAQEISGPEGKPIQSQHVELNVTELMMNPELARAAQSLALAISNPQRERAQGERGMLLLARGNESDQDQEEDAL